jgi:two-component system chemotaxis sensor kinase CheA
MARDPYRYFRLEARELLDQLAKGALELESAGANPTLVQRLLRLAHTLKGAARVVNELEIANGAHGVEDVLAPFRRSTANVPRESVDEILKHLDTIGHRVAALTPSEVPKAAETRPISDDLARTVRADIADVDALLQGVSEAHASLNGLRAISHDMEHERTLADLLVQQLALPPTDLHRRDASTNPAHAIAKELRDGLGKLDRNIAVAADQMDRELRELRDAAEQLRLVSTRALFTALERTARDTAQTLSKQVAFHAIGGDDFRLDGRVLATVQGALVQLVRNAVAHGIEGEAERRAAGKPNEGHVAVEISRRGRSIAFECRDDGRGVDVNAVRRVAIERGILSAEAQAYGSEEVVRLLLRGGISTSARVTEAAGRGIGLDVVREAVERLGGDASFRSENGKGTAFCLVVPPSLASTEMLMVESSATVLAIPLDAVTRSMHVAPQDISPASGGASVLCEDKIVPFVPLPTALDGTRLPAGRAWTAVVVSGADGVAAIGVDRLLGVSRIVVHPLPEFAPANPVIGGAVLDGEGNPQLVLDPDALVVEARRSDFVDAVPQPSQSPILVIDDSLTTRMLEQSILESAGFDVDVALSGEEALEKALGTRYGLFLVDVEMPGIDGFTFIERARSHASLADIPAILVTSRTAPEDRERAQEVGARGYVVKSDFDQGKLLSMIRELMK